VVDIKHSAACRSAGTITIPGPGCRGTGIEFYPDGTATPVYTLRGIGFYDASWPLPA